MRLIDADELTERLWRFGLGTREEVAGLVANMPTIEAEPIRHGHWQRGEDMFGNYYKCSVCDSTEDIGWGFDYCPNCGAKMDEVTE